MIFIFFLLPDQDKQKKGFSNHHLWSKSGLAEANGNLSTGSQSKAHAKAFENSYCISKKCLGEWKQTER